MATLLEDLHVCWYQVNKQTDGSYKILCNDEWLEAVKNKQIQLQDGNLYHSNLPSPIECKLLLEPSNTDPSPAGLHIVHVYLIPRQGRVRYSKIQKTDNLYTDNSLGQLMCLVDYELIQQEKKKGNSITVQPIQSNTFSEEVFEDITTVLSSNDHPGSQFLVGHSISETAFYLCFRHHSFRLKDVICYSPTLLIGSHRPLFIVYQLLQYLRWLHSHGLTHDHIRTTNLYVDEKLWLSVGAPRLGLLPVSREEVKQIEEIKEVKLKEKRLLYPFTGPPDSILSACGAWVKGYLSNLDYLLLLNQYSGKVLGDPNLHPVIPWVMDFSSSYGGWRDLSKSKFRLNKGDQHLDSTYKIHGMRVSAPSWMRSRRSFHEEESETPITPHHLIDTLSEITYFSYKARRMPKALLCKYVRSKWEPQEYPATMSHLYKWTPDECIPEFYTDKTIFASVHSDLPDLALPPWASDSQDFIRKHRDALEGDYVSSRLHNWIDLMFGEKLFGAAAIASKNVFKELVDNHKTITNKGVRQLFQFAHPRRLTSSPPVPQLPQSTHEIVAANKIEMCEEPDYEEDQDNSPIRRCNTYQAKGAEKPPVQRNHSVDPSLLKNLINKKYNQRNEGARLDSIQELIFSPVRLSKEEENITAKIRYLNQFFSSLGGSIWEDEESETTRSYPPIPTPPTPPTPPATPATPLSLKARQRQDIQSVGCVLIEILSSTRIPEYEDMSREQYLQEASFLWNKNKDEIFMCFNDLIEYLLYSDDVFCTTDYLLHPHFNNLAMPLYFDSLYNLIFSLEQQDTIESTISHCGAYLKNNPKFLSSLGSSGMLLLLGYLKPLFSGTHSCKAFIKLFDTIAVHCDHKALELLSECLEQFYRNCTSSSERMMLSNVNFIMSVKRHFGLRAFLNKFIGHIIENIVDTESSSTFQTEEQTWSTQVQASPLALECYTTLKQVLPTLGPILTAKHVTNKLLQVLVGCHVYNEVTNCRPGGEELITKFLIDIALIYGEAFIDTQYIPRVFNMIKSAMFRVTNKNEGKLLAALNVVGDSIKCLDGPTLHNMLGDLQRFIFEPIMRLLTSSRIIFPHSGSGRLLLCRALSNLLVNIVKHVQYSNIQDPEAGKSLVFPLVKQYFLMFDVVSYLYREEETTPESCSGASGAGNGATDVLSPSQYSLLSQDADYFIHLKQQFPLYPKRYHSQSITDTDPCQIDVGSSPVSGVLNLADALQLECETIVEQQLPKTPTQETSSLDTGTPDDRRQNVREEEENVREEEEDGEENIHFSLLPPGADIMSHRSRAVRAVSVMGTDTDPDSYSVDKETPGLNRGAMSPRSRPSSPSLSSESESDETIPEDPVKDVDCLSDGSKKERTIQSQIETCLAPEVAQNTYVHLCRLIGQETLRRTLDNIELIEVLAYMDIPYVETATENAPKPRYGSETNSVPYTYPSPLLSCKPLDQCDSLRDNWRRVWETCVTSTSDHFSFKHIFLQQFTGHSDRINALRVTDDECFLLSGSKDKTVILWDLRATNTGLGSKIKRFEEHVRPVLGLTFLDYSYTTVSMDTQQTICTDLERQKVVSKYDSKNAVVLTNLPRASNRIIQGTSDSTLRTFDTRVKDGVVMEWKVATPLRSVQIIKALQCDPTGTWVAAGFSSGTIHVLDLRVGVMMHAFRPHQQDVTNIICGDSGDVFTSSNDTNVSVCHWKRARTFTEGHQPDYKYQGYRDGVNGMCLLDDDLITCANYRITTISPAGNSTTKLRSDLFRGGVSAMTVSPLNKLVVVGSDSGSLRLLS
ncbi:WD repeat-containing protein 81-like isoform X2 [Bolinopsis microptera]|uniref:WD repeat-containing protein 81-like isoform X2 n=1 Tax=Bolinopsis microptera TaxID=2820187 RepID=UPI003078F84F